MLIIVVKMNLELCIERGWMVGYSSCVQFVPIEYQRYT